MDFQDSVNSNSGIFVLNCSLSDLGGLSVYLSLLCRTGVFMACPVLLHKPQDLLGTPGLMLTPFGGKPEQARVQTRSQADIVRMKLKYEPKKDGVLMSTNLDINTVTCFS